MNAPDPARCHVVELRQYTLHPGRRDDLIDVFDRELVEAQEAEGMAVLGQFRDLDAPDRFAWLRGFADMDGRRRGLAGFYGGPVWARHGPAANETMVDWKDVRLLRPAWPGSHVRLREDRAAPGVSGAAPGLLDVAVFPLREPAGDALLATARDRLTPLLQDGGARWVGWYVTEPAENDFPRLPVREGPVLAGFALFDDAQAFDAFARSGAWSREAAPLLAPDLAGAPETRRLQPTARSRVRAA